MLATSRIAATIPVGDLDRARSFYGETLGLKPVFETEEGAAYEATDGALYLYVRPAVAAEHTLAGFVVDDIETTVRELENRGVHFEDYDLPGIKTVGHIAERPTGRSAWFRDSEDNILGVVEEGAR